MLNNKSYKFRLYPNNKQIEYFANCFGCVRFLYNQMLNERISAYEQYKGNKEKLKSIKWKNYTSFKKDFEWLYNVDSLALANAQLNLQTAYNNFFRGKGKVGFPKFKSKHKDLDSYTTNNQNNNIRIENKHIKLPKIGLVRIKQHRQIPINQKIKSCTISRTKSGKYYISILVEWYSEDISLTLDTNKAIGLDYSSPHFYIDNQNASADYPKFYRNAEKQIARAQRQLSKCINGSNNYYKQKKKIAIISEHITNQRKDWLEKLSRKIANDYDIVCIESLNMKAMSEGLKLGKSTMDNGWGQFVCMLERKVKKVVKIDKWFPSSKLCPVCGCVNKNLTLKDRIWTCDCGNIINRDYNAANNILAEGLRILTQN